MPARRGTVAGIGLYVLAILLLSVMDALIKWASDHFPTPEIAFARVLFGLWPVALLARRGGLAVLRTRRLAAHIGRGLIATVATLCFFYAFRFMPLADAYAIGFAAPLFITALSAPLLGERVEPRLWLAVAVGFAGVMVMLRPGQADLAGFLSIGAGAALLGTLGYALSIVLLRRMSRTETNAALILYAGLVTLAGSAALLPLDFVSPLRPAGLVLVGIGLLGGLGMLALTEAFRLAPASVLAPFEYTAMIWGVMLGFAVWGDLPDAWILTGSAIVVASGLYILQREMRREAGTTAAADTPPAAAAAAPAPAARRG